MTQAAHSARVIRGAFASYRRNMEIARDPDEGKRTREVAWSRAAKARARLERHADLIAGAVS